MPLFTSLSNSSAQYFCDSAETLLMSSRVIDWRAIAGGLTGNGCVDQVSSPGTLLWGTGRSSIGNKGFPVTRLKTKTNPIFVTTATAGTERPARRSVINDGCAGKS